MICQFNQPGNIAVAITLTLKGCSAIQYQKIVSVAADNGNYSWRIKSGANYLDTFNFSGWRMCHLVTRGRASGLVEIELTVNNIGEPLKRLIKLYVISYYQINKLSAGSVSIERQQSENSIRMLSYSPAATSYQYQIIQIGTGTVCLKGTCPVNNEYLEIDTSGLSHGAYTIVITENGEVKHSQNMMF